MKIPIINNKEAAILNLIANYGYITSSSLDLLIPQRQNIFKYKKLLESKELIYCINKYSKVFWLLTSFGESLINVYNPDKGLNYSLDDTDPTLINHTEKQIAFEIKLLNLAETQKIPISEFVSDRFLSAKILKLRTEENKEILKYYRVPDSEFIYQEDKKVAVEIELSIKSKFRYFKIFHFYRDFYHYKKVYWLYENTSVRDKLYNIFMNLCKENETKLETQINDEDVKRKLKRNLLLHTFVDINDFFSNGFNAKMVTPKDLLHGSHI
jgi:hypothetical protein